MCIAQDGPNKSRTGGNFAHANKIEAHRAREAPHQIRHDGTPMPARCQRERCRKITRGRQRGKGLGGKRLFRSVHILDVYLSVCISSQRSARDPPSVHAINPLGGLLFCIRYRDFAQASDIVEWRLCRLAFRHSDGDGAFCARAARRTVSLP